MYNVHAKGLQGSAMAGTITIRCDESVKRKASEVARSYGLDLSSVTRAFWHQIARTGNIPLSFYSEEPNEESLESIRDAERIIAEGRPGYETAEEMFAAMGL